MAVTKSKTTEKKSNKSCIVIGIVSVLLLCCCSTTFIMGLYYLLGNSGFVAPYEVDDYLSDDSEPFFEDYSNEESRVTLKDVRTEFLAANGYRFNGTIHYPDGDVTVAGTYLQDGSETYFTYDDLYGDVSEVTIGETYYINYGDGWEITDEPYNAGIQRIQLMYMLNNGGDSLIGEAKGGYLVFSYFDDEYGEDFILYVDPETNLPSKLEYDYYSTEEEEYISEEMLYSEFNSGELEVIAPDLP